MHLNRTPIALTLTAATLLTAAAPVPAPSTAATASSESDPVDLGGLRIIKTDPEGRPVTGTAFQLLDASGKTLADGKTGNDGTLTFTELVPGIARLKETASGSPLLDTLPDQDVVIVPGPPADLPITDPYKAATLTLKITDKATGKGLAGAVTNVTPKGAKDNKGAFALTTGKDGTAKATLPVGKKTGTIYTLTQTKAPGGHRPQTAPVDVTALPGQTATASLVNTATSAPPTQKPTPRPTTSASGQPAPSSSSSASPAGEGSIAPSSAATPGAANAATGSASPTDDTSSAGALANTGSTNGTLALLAGGASLVIAGAVTVYFTWRRRKTDSAPGVRSGGQHRRSNTS